MSVVAEESRVRHAVRVLLIDEHDRLLLLRARDRQEGNVFWFPVGGGLEEGEDVDEAAAREVAEETGLVALALGPEVWRRCHLFTWRGARLDQRERWFLARVTHFEPAGAGMTEAEKADLTACRWWTLDELDATTDDLTPRDLAVRLRALLADGPPAKLVRIGL